MLRSLALSCTVLALAGEALAAGGPYPPPCGRKPTPADVEAARSLHSAAKQYLAKGLYDKAVETWLESYGFDCTKHELLINIGLAYEQKGNPEKALEAYQTYIDRKGAAADPDTVAKAKSLEAVVETRRKAAAAAQVQAQEYANQKDGADGSGSSESAGASPGPWPWVVVGVGGALSVTGAALLGVGVSKTSHADEICPDRNCGNATNVPEEQLRAAQDEGNRGLQFERVGVPVMLVGLATAGGGLAWHFLAPSGATSSTSARGLTLTPQLAPGLYGLTGRFSF